jgi:predicted nucleotidyltransferase
MREGDLLASLRRLRDYEIEFIVVGGLAAVLNGAPIQTFDTDVVYSLDPVNIDRIAACRSHVAAGGQLNLITRFGPLDLLGTIGQGLGYSELLSQSNEMEIGQGIRVRVLNLETIIAVKEQLASEKDLAVLPVLRRTLSENRRRRCDA